MQSERAIPWKTLPVESKAQISEAEARERALEAVLVVAGEFGYRATSVRAILDRSGGNRRQFYELFAGKEDCFEQAYAVWITRVGTTVLAAAAAAGSSWTESVQAGLVALFQFITQQPLIARSLFIEVPMAGGSALAEYDETMERIAEALDNVRNEIEDDQKPPASTAMFIVGGIEACVCDALTAGDPQRVWGSLPELMHLAVGSYLSTTAAEAAFEEAKVPQERERILWEAPKAE